MRNPVTGGLTGLYYFRCMRCMGLRIDREVPLAHVGEAHGALNGRRPTDKLLIVPWDQPTDPITANPSPRAAEARRRSKATNPSSRTPMRRSTNNAVAS